MDLRLLLLISASALFIAGAAQADPPPISSADDAYSRLSRWEQHLGHKIGDEERDRTIDPGRARTMEENLDSIQSQVERSYHDNTLDPDSFGRFASELKDIGDELGDDDWAEHNVYAEGSDDHDNGYGETPPPPPAYDYYREGDYERSCHEGNVAAGTIFGAIAGGLIGGAVSHGNAGAVVGGVVVGGALGNALSQDIPCDDRRYAYDAYYQSLNGDVDHDYDWRHGDSYGSFRATREYSDNGRECRDWHAVTYRDGQRFERDGTACRRENGTWETG